MKTARAIDELQEKFGCCVATIGNFDGLHLGHRKILERVLSKSRALGCPSLLITFDPHPSTLLYPTREVSMLTTTKKKLRLIEECGIDAVLLLEFTLAFAHKTAKDFVMEVLLPLSVRELFVGHDFAFGKGRGGNVNALARMGTQYGFGVYEIEEVQVGGEFVRSSRIRTQINNGDVKTAARLLDRPHAVTGTVVAGHGRGKTIGFPTCNIDTPYETIPAPGVYATRTWWDGHPYPSATHIGTIPTFDVETPSIETHLFDFDNNLLGETIEIEFLEKIRGTEKFDSPEDLSRQIEADCAHIREILKVSP